MKLVRLGPLFKPVPAEARSLKCGVSLLAKSKIQYHVALTRDTFAPVTCTSDNNSSRSDTGSAPSIPSTHSFSCSAQDLIPDLADHPQLTEVSADFHRQQQIRRRRSDSSRHGAGRVLHGELRVDRHVQSRLGLIQKPPFQPDKRIIQTASRPAIRHVCKHPPRLELQLDSLAQSVVHIDMRERCAAVPACCVPRYTPG